MTETDGIDVEPPQDNSRPHWKTDREEDFFLLGLAYGKWGTLETVRRNGPPAELERLQDRLQVSITNAKRRLQRESHPEDDTDTDDHAALVKRLEDAYAQRLRVQLEGFALLDRAKALGHETLDDDEQLRIIFDAMRRLDGEIIRLGDRIAPTDDGGQAPGSTINGDIRIEFVGRTL